VFGNYSIPIAAKTGTTQSSTSASNSGVFVCYAPADDPEIAIAVVIEKGTSGSTVMTVAADIIDAYFGENSGIDASVVYEGTLIQ
jgi:penicillin-binding protein 2